MDSNDLLSNLDWDPDVLASIFDSDFYDMNELWMCQ